MKGIHIFCASQSSTAISLTMNEPSSSSSTIRLGGSGGGPAIDRHNPIIKDPRRFGKTLPSDHIPSSSSPHPPIIKPSPQNKNFISITNIYSNPNAEKPNKNHNKKNKKINHKGSINLKPSVNDTTNNNNISSTASLARKSWSCSSKASAGEFISPPGSSRYLLSDDQSAFFNVKSDSDPVLKLLPPEKSNNIKALQKDESSCSFRPSSSSRSPDQVVVLRVSLHCRGCERKMKKHISRMEGVSSFNIDFAAKKVTVVGNVTPLAVLASISKVKNAQLWTPPPAAPPFGPTYTSEINKNKLQSTIVLS